MMQDRKNNIISDNPARKIDVKMREQGYKIISRSKP